MIRRLSRQPIDCSLKSGSSPKRRGAAAVELALVLPPLLLLVLGCVDLGRAASLEIALSNAARVAAEYGGTHRFTNYTRDSWETQVRQEAITEMQSVHGYDSSKLTQSVQTAVDSSAVVQVTVTVSYPFQMISTWPGLPNNFAIQQSVTERQFQ